MRWKQTRARGKETSKRMNDKHRKEILVGTGSVALVHSGDGKNLWPAINISLLHIMRQMTAQQGFVAYLNPCPIDW